MSILFKTALRYLLYPLSMLFTLYITLLILNKSMPYWPTAILLILASGAVIALAERYLPYQVDWLESHQDTLTDIIHAIFNLILIVSVAYFIEYLNIFRFFPRLWPDQLAWYWQLLIVGLVIDFGLWLMHYISHKYKFLWKLHAIHHQSSRLYWLNAEKRHPLSALILAGPSLIVLTLCGAPSQLIAGWMMLMAVHLFFQHANVDYRASIFKYIFAVAEVHRLHHKHGFGRKNFGEVFIFWDILFKTFYYETNKVAANKVGVRNPIPNQYIGQLKWPFNP
ncbi:sterol desaturase family protein [Acinetobacter rudis]|uniref:sterol desaturase family protein n=1 Tax=Acinetobacter rudis TaxID=632955 RepID=UPI00280E3823|nr:sterol desaturase family protein [Acinetobacter rudis]MDQ8953265.1 sterol desaturase family protein [Acinetobacter rudis]